MLPVELLIVFGPDLLIHHETMRVNRPGKAATRF